MRRNPYPSRSSPTLFGGGVVPTRPVYLPQPEVEFLFSMPTAETIIMRSGRKTSAIANVIRTSNGFLLGVVFAFLAADPSQIALAQKAPEATGMPDFAPAMIDHMHKMRRYKDPDHGAQHTPPMIDRFSVDRDPSGAIASFQP